jgi:hypothetical protein
MRTMVRLALALALLWPAAAAAQGERFQRIDRLAPEHRGLDGIGQIVRETGSHGTGFLVSPCHVVTNHHVARPEDEAATDRLYFRVGQAPAGHAEAFRSVHRLEYLAGGDFPGAERARREREAERDRRDPPPHSAEWLEMTRAIAAASWRARGEDWAILRLEGGQRAAAPYLRLAGEIGWRGAAEREIGLAGFPGRRGDADQFRTLWGQFDCRLASGFARIPYLVDPATGELVAWPLRCGIRRMQLGMSGAPVVVREGGGLVAVGTYNSRLAGDDDGAEISGVAPAARFAPRAEAAMRASPCRP